MRRAILVSTDCRWAIYGTLYSNLLDNLTHQLNSVGPDQTPHYAVSHLGSHCLYICPVYEMLCSNRLDWYDVTTNVANYDIQSAKSADPDQMPHYMRSLIWVHTVCIMSHLWDTLPFQQIVQAPIRRHMYKNGLNLGINTKYHRFFVLCYSVVVVIFQNYNLSKRFENLSPEETKSGFH